MQLYIIRHADAFDMADQGCSTDAERRLTARGRRQSTRVGRCLRQLGVEAATIFTSPLPRATETAELLRCELSDPGVLRETDLLAPPGDAAGLRRLVVKDGHDVVVVGHQPFLGEFLTSLVCGNSLDLHLGKGTIAGLHLRDGNWRLRFLLSSQIMKALLNR